MEVDGVIVTVAWQDYYALQPRWLQPIRDRVTWLQMEMSERISMQEEMCNQMEAKG